MKTGIFLICVGLYMLFGAMMNIGYGIDSNQLGQLAGYLFWGIILLGYGSYRVKKSMSIHKIKKVKGATNEKTS